VALDDLVAVEAPLALQVEHGPAGARTLTPLGLTMRTPGDEADLLAGFLVAEGVLRRPADLVDVVVGRDVARAVVAADVPVDLGGLARHGTTTSACGACGKAALPPVCDVPPLPTGPRVAPAVVLALPERLRAAQAAFDATGGLHAAGLFDPDGTLRVVREDVGRHNAVDKVIGAALRGGGWPPGEALLQVSGRASWELVHKAVRAGIPWLSAVGAPSSLAVELAAEHGLTLVGFVRADGFVVYAGRERVVASMLP
jgi:FdhD protein